MSTLNSPQTTSESHEDVLIVGAGQAAAELVKTLRTEGFQGSIRVLGAEGYLPYDRPPLSKGAMTNTLNMARLAFLNDSGYEKYDTAVDLGVEVTRIDVDQKVAHTSNGRVINYGVCVMATGARAVPAPWPGVDRIHAIRTYDDALRLGETITNGARRFLVVGGGYLGLETASSLSQSGLEVSLVEASPQLLTGRASKFVAEWLRKQHEANGVKIYLGSMVAELEQVDDEVRVRLANGSEITADEVVFAVGALANLDLAKAAGAECGRGVLVNDHCATTVPDLYAIGDVASFRTKSGDEARVESVFNAKSQAKILARALAGKESKLVGAPTFWSDQVGASIRLAGWVPPTIDTNDVVTQDETGWLVERYLGGRLVGIESHNRLPEYMRMLPEIMDLRKVL